MGVQFSLSSFPGYIIHSGFVHISVSITVISKMKLPHLVALLSRRCCLPSQFFLFCVLGVLLLDLADTLCASVFVLHEEDGLLVTFLMQGAVFCPVVTHCFTPRSVDIFTPGGYCGHQIYM